MALNTYKYTLFLFLSFFYIFHTQANTYYVATNGNDNNNGSLNAPFATFSKAVSEMVAGDTCIIRGGVYNQELFINKNGTSGNYLTFKAADGEIVEIKATSFINNWQPHSGNIYKTTVNMAIDDRFKAVYYQGDFMDLARWPNNVDNNRWTIDCTPVTGGDNTHFQANNIPNIDWTGGLVYYLGAHSGTSWTRTITSSTTNSVNYTSVDISGWPFSVHNPTVWRNNPGNNRGQLYLFNKLEALDYPREWYYDSGTNTLYFQTPNGNPPTNNSVEFATRKYAAELHGDYIKLEGLHFFGGSVRVRNNADNNQIINCKVTHGSEGLDSLTNTSAQVPEAAIEVLGDNTLIKGCEVNHSSVSGIFIAGWAAANCTVEGNYISNIDYLGIHASPIRTTGSGIKILKNTISNAGRDGMFVSGLNCEIAYNDVSASQRINSDSGVFYTVGNNDLKNTEIHHNWFHDATAPSYSHNPTKPGKAAGIYLDNNSKGYTVHHNVVWNVSWNGYQVNWNNTNLDFYHNTIWNAYNAMDSWVNGFPQSNNKIYNNYSNIGTWFEGNGPQEFEIRDSPIFSTSPFEDPNNLNFMPTQGSALVDQAPEILGFEKHFAGTAADIGAYERGGSFWTAGVNAIEDCTTGDAICTVNIAPKIYLQGAMLHTTDGMMRDNLRADGLIPLTSPYEDGVTIDQTVLNVTGANAIVDWIWLELRATTDNSITISGQSALLQRDGDIVAIDGSNTITLNEGLGDYYLVIKHRNHLSIITNQAIALSSIVTPLDFTQNTALVAGGNLSMKQLDNGSYALVAGDYDGNEQVQTTDLTQIITLLGNAEYHEADMDMNGQIQTIDANLLLIPNIGRSGQMD